jgi:Double zinc ribbon
VTLASFISPGAQHAILNGLEFLAFLIWLSLGYWTYKDARRRIEDPMLIGVATLIAVVLPFLGPFIYMLFRPPEYLEDVRERQLEIKAMEDRIASVDQHCPVCHAEVDAGFLVCPVCTTKLKQACVSCGSPLEPIWQVCPYCETPIEPALPGAPPALGTRRARRTPR